MESKISSALRLQRFDAFKVIESVSNVPQETVKSQLRKFEKILQNAQPQNPIQPIRHTDSSSSSLLNKRRKLPLKELSLPANSSRSTDEEVPARDLQSIWELVSQTEEQSPRNHLGDKWREYHGSDDWSGMLDPLDENLRREVVRYGEFVQSAYSAFNSNPECSDEEEELFPLEVPLPDASYTVTKSLYATSAIGLPKWVDDMAPDLSFMTQRSSWIGYVAVCDDEREI